MTNPIDCDEFTRTLADFLERDVDEPTRSAVESHALSCTDCGPLLADLRRLRIDAANLPELTPSRDLWAGIAARIEAPVVPIEQWDARGGKGTGEGQPERRGTLARRNLRTWWPAAAAAAALVAVTASVTYVATRLAVPGRASHEIARGPGGGEPLPGSSTAPSSVARAVVSPESTGASSPPSARLVSNVKRVSAEATYGQEIDRLRTILGQRRSQLDTGTVHVIERNLQVIDDAIAQCRLALAKDPASRFLMESLNNALETKIELLRTAASLPAHS